MNDKLLFLRRVMVGWVFFAALYASRNGPAEAVFSAAGWTFIFLVMYFVVWVTWHLARLISPVSPRPKLEDDQPDDGVLPDMTRK